MANWILQSIWVNRVLRLILKGAYKAPFVASCLNRIKLKKDASFYEDNGSAIVEPDIPGWFTMSEMQLLYDTVHSANAARCLEIGSYMGRSTYAIASALKDLGGERNLMCVDPFASPVSPEYYERDAIRSMLAAYRNVEDDYTDCEKRPTTLDCFNLTMDRYPFMRDYVAVRRALSQDVDFLGMQFDFAFIDGDHSYEGAKRDYCLIRACMADRGVVCFHDYQRSFPGVIKFVDELRESGGMKLVGEGDSLRVFVMP